MYNKRHIATWSFYMKSKDKIARLKEEIDMNMVPNVVQAGGSPEYCFGDLVDIGYAEKLSEGTGRYTREECRRYTGPNSINTNWNGIMKAGDQTDWIEKDYS